MSSYSEWYILLSRHVRMPLMISWSLSSTMRSNGLSDICPRMQTYRMRVFQHLMPSVSCRSSIIPHLLTVVPIDVVVLSRGVCPHFAEPVIATGIRHHPCHPQVLRLVEALVAKTDLKVQYTYTLQGACLTLFIACQHQSTSSEYSATRSVWKIGRMSSSRRGKRSPHQAPVHAFPQAPQQYMSTFSCRTSGSVIFGIVVYFRSPITIYLRII